MNRVPVLAAAAVALALFGALDGAPAQDQAPSNRLEEFGQDTSRFFGRLFGQEQGQPAGPVVTAQMSGPDLIVRLDRLENQIRQLTGAIEQLQHRNQQLEQQMLRLQGQGGGAAPAVAPPGVPARPGDPRPRSDVFDPAAQPSAPGAPRPLGSIIADEGDDGGAIGAPGGRAAGAPLDLGTLSGQAAADPALRQGPAPDVPGPRAPAGAQLTMAPSQTPRDEYDLAYGYILRKDYALAENSLRAFLKKYPNDRLAPEAQYWLGESLFQRQQYRDAAEAFLTVSTKHEGAAKAPEALLRLGQSLAALNEKEAACATLGEIVRKYPRASTAVKQGVEREQKRVRC
jgi:tol-pal system protein YbgF